MWRSRPAGKAGSSTLEQVGAIIVQHEILVAPKRSLFMPQPVDFKADADDVLPEKSKAQFAQGGNPDLAQATKQSDASWATVETDDRTLMMLQAFEGRA
jgi:hypothetical protein